MILLININSFIIVYKIISLTKIVILNMHGSGNKNGGPRMYELNLND